MIRVKHCIEPVSFYLGLGLLLYSFKSNHCSPANPQWRSGIGDGCRHHAPGSILTLTLTIFSLKTGETYAPLLKSVRRSLAPLQKSCRNHHSYVWSEALSGIVVLWAQKVSSIECFHMTSRRPCWCPKPISWELNIFSYANAFFCSNKFA